MGVRDTRRIVGEFELTIEDFKSARQFPDQIAVYNRPTDVHPTRYRLELRIVPEQENGRVVGTGTHHELLASCPTYQEIVNSQLTAEEAGMAS